MGTEFSFRLKTNVAANPNSVWQHMTSIAGVNREFFPLLKMTGSRKYQRLDDHSEMLGKQLFRSWILLFGIVPVEYDDLCIIELVPGKKFVEASSMLMQKKWRHERSIEALPDFGSTIEDHICFEARFPILAPISYPIILALFKYRHFRLQQILGPR